MATHAAQQCVGCWKHFSGNHANRGENYVTSQAQQELRMSNMQVVNAAKPRLSFGGLGGAPLHKSKLKKAKEAAAAAAASAGAPASWPAKPVSSTRQAQPWSIHLKRPPCGRQGPGACML